MNEILSIHSLPPHRMADYALASSGGRTVGYRCPRAPGSWGRFLRQVARLLLLSQFMGGGATGIPAWQKLVGTHYYGRRSQQALAC